MGPCISTPKQAAPSEVADSGAFYTLVPIRPRPRGERHSLRTLPGVSLRPGSLAFNPRPRRLSTPPDAFELHPDIALYGTALSRHPPAPRRVPGAREAMEHPERLQHVAGHHLGRERRRGQRPQGANSVDPARSRPDADDARLSFWIFSFFRTTDRRASASRVLLTLVPIRPRWCGERRSLRTFASRVVARAFSIRR